MNKPGTPEDLPSPRELLVRAATMAAVEAAVPHDAYSAFFTVNDDGVGHQDGGGNDWALEPLEGGRAVLYGCDHEMSWTRFHEPPLDLLAGAPGWLPLERLADMQAAKELGFVYWYDGTWHRVDYPDGLRDDGLASTVGGTADVVRLLDHVANDVIGARWGGEEVEEDDGLMAALEETVRAAREGALEETLRRAREGALSAESFAWLSNGWEPDLSAALDIARHAGLTPNAPQP
ncbi:hypothetical protein [Actinomadura montaniterrae]|uniref:Uncharacterized protein n=1 Tax=Actinomadura montaniterrae TaxID=1803903 RepID=A0A6L3VRJ7_9ACTN|nr:hypothetical protein [Actinomadura montaniterrae]KAB2369628.1 hypothetical protein F9B16_36640 [Actinomadura montaniterrae]